MKLRILGGGWYGCHLALALSKEHEVELYEVKDDLFLGASGSQPARLHLGFHYPRSDLTRSACRNHYKRFMETYGFLTRCVPINIYAIARDHSWIDFGTYKQILDREVEFVTIENPEEFGLRNVEGALLTGERHVIIREARAFFKNKLGKIVHLNATPAQMFDNRFDNDLTIDCTFKSQDNIGVDRYEPCLTVILEGHANKAVTIMDGPFPSLYPWDEHMRYCSLTSATLTPLSKTCRTYEEADRLRYEAQVPTQLHGRAQQMIAQMEHYYPAIRQFEVVDYKLAVRAMPLSGADARLVDIRRANSFTIDVRASKIDAIFYAEDIIRDQYLNRHAAPKVPGLDGDL